MGDIFCLSNHAMAYDAARSRIVLYGGDVPAGCCSNSTVEWDGTKWVFSPFGWLSARSGHAMAFDSARSRVVLFGGEEENEVVVNDTWEFDGTNWLQANPANAPPSLREHAIAFDTVRQRVVLFGGIGSDFKVVGDTWTFNGVDWTLAATSGPSPRALHIFVWDTWRGVGLLFGGTIGPGGGGGNDLWEWDGQSWENVPIDLADRPIARVSMAAAFDSKRGVLVINGGRDEDNNTLADTWEYRPCYPDCERDCDLDIFDFLCFQDKFVDGHPFADFERDDDLDLFDFLKFQDEFVNGCG